MSGAFLEVEVDTREIEKALLNLQHAVGDLEPVFREIGEYLLRSHEERFRAGVDPDGNLWDELSPDYKARKPKNQDKVLVLSGDLMDSLNYDPSPDGLEFGTNVIYAAIHQFGGEIQHAAHSQRAFTDKRWVTIGEHTTKVPERPILGISNEDEAEILMSFEDYLTAAI